MEAGVTDSDVTNAVSPLFSADNRRRSQRAALRSSPRSGRSCCAAAATLEACSAARAACSNSDSGPLKLAAMKSGRRLIEVDPIVRTKSGRRKL